MRAARALWRVARRAAWAIALSVRCLIRCIVYGGLGVVRAIGRIGAAAGDVIEEC